MDATSLVPTKAESLHAQVDAIGDDSATLRTQAGLVKTVKRYSSSKGARIAMGRMSDGWREVAA